MKVRTQFRCIIVDGNNGALCTGIAVNVPPGLNRLQAQEYVTGVIAGEVRRYAASEALGLGPVSQETDWSAIVT